MTHPDDEYKPKPKPDNINFHKKLKKLSRKGLLVPDVIPYPGDNLRLVVRNQLIVHLEQPLDAKTRSISLVGTDDKNNLLRQEAKVIRRSHCNPNLVLLEGQDVHLFTGKLEVVYSPDTITPPPKVRDSSANDVHYSDGGETITPPPKVRDSSGGGGGAPTTAIVPASFDAQLRRIIADSPDWEEFPVVAVMDTGIDFAYPNTEAIPILYNGGKPTCHTIEPDYIGWDFVHDQNDPYDDDDNSKHGSRIAAIISREMEHRVRILPLKVIDRLGVGLLFDIYCGFEYLLSGEIAKPVAINASWGFYRDTQDSLMTKYVERLLEAGIWLINAAGNRGDIEANEIKDLADKLRWPACYSNHHPHVVTVTTVKKCGDGETDYEVVENYGKDFVNIGIGSGPNDAFHESLVTKDTLPQIKGSSYAAPYVAAFIAEAGHSPDTLNSRLALLRTISGGVTALPGEISHGVIRPVEVD